MQVSSFLRLAFALSLLPLQSAFAQLRDAENASSHVLVPVAADLAQQQPGLLARLPQALAAPAQVAVAAQAAVAEQAATARREGWFIPGVGALLADRSAVRPRRPHGRYGR